MAIKPLDLSKIPTLGAGAGIIGFGAGTVDQVRYDRKAVKQGFLRMVREKNALGVLHELPKPGHDVALILDGTWHGFDILAAVLELAGCPITQLDIATLGFNRIQTERLAELIAEGQIAAPRFILSEMFAAKNGAEYEYLAKTLEPVGGSVHNTRNHAKIIALTLQDGREFALHGSLNLRRCNSYEQLVISHDSGLVKFFRSYMDDAIAGSL